MSAPVQQPPERPWPTTRDQTGAGRPPIMPDEPLDPPGDEDLTDVVRELYDLPFHRANDVEVVVATAEYARLRWPYDESLVGNPEVDAIHGGVISSLADVAGAAPLVGALGDYTPTIDLRIDYVTHATAGDLLAEAEVRRRGGSIGASDVTVYAGDDRVAVARGVYKLSR